MIQVYQGDCLQWMQNIPDKSVDMVLCDLPYGRTKNKWDKIIDPAALWEQYERIIKDNGAIVLFTMQPFTAQMIMSNPKLYRYEWIWEKTQAKGHMNAKKMPMRAHENVEVFYKHLPTYNPQKTTGHERKYCVRNYKREAGSGCYGAEERHTVYDSTERYPRSVQKFSNGDQAKRFHVTQKPVSMCEYFILTYTNAGETVLDNCMGSASTGVACINTGRSFIGGELEPETYKKAAERMRAAGGMVEEMEVEAN